MATAWVALPAAAQTPVESNPSEGAPDGAAAPAPVQAAPAPAVPAEVAPPAAACVPECRVGFTCIEGACVSECNPPCPTGHTCSQRQCLPPAPATTPTPTAYPGHPMAEWNAAAPEHNPMNPGAEEHDGFMLRLTFGLGQGWLTEDVTLDAGFTRDDSTTNYDGTAGTFSIDLGGAASDMITLHARLATLAIVNPSVEVDGESIGEFDELSISATLFAPAITFYFMPVNVYTTFAIGGSYITFSVDDRDVDDVETDIGYGINLDVGKEWWSSDQWGLGVAGRLWWTAVVEDVDAGEDRLSMLALTLQFSATYQ